MNISILIPAYNEEPDITRVIRDVKETVEQNKSIDRYEIIVIDDGSTDNTYNEILKENVLIIRHVQRMGYGASLKDGIVKAKYDHILTIDADDVFPAKEINNLLPFADDYAMVVASRTGKDVPIDILRKVSKWILRRLVFALTGHKVSDLNSGMRIFKKDLVKKYFNIISDGFSFTTTITIAFLSDRLPIKFIPINCRERVSGKSKIRPLTDFAGFIILILRAVMYFNPLGIFLRLTFLFGICLIISIGFDIFVYRNLTDSTIILLVSSLFFFSIGLLADLINKRSLS